MNTLFYYIYRDADNYKSHNNMVVDGKLNADEKAEIFCCLNDGEYFIPSQVGLPEKRIDDNFTDADHPWFELRCIEDTEAPTTVPGLTAQDLLTAFRAAQGNWDESRFYDSVRAARINDICRQAVDTFGTERQILSTITMLSELQAALVNYLLVPDEDDTTLNEVLVDIAESRATAEIMLRQLSHIFGDVSDVVQARTKLLENAIRNAKD